MRTLCICTLLARASAHAPLLRKELQANYDVDAHGHLHLHRHHKETTFHQEDEKSWGDENDWGEALELEKTKEMPIERHTETTFHQKDEKSMEDENTWGEALELETTKEVYIFLNERHTAPKQVYADLDQYNITYENFTHQHSWNPPGGVLIIPEQEVAGIYLKSTHEKEISDFVEKGGRVILLASHSDEGKSPGITFAENAFKLKIVPRTHPATRGLALNPNPDNCQALCNSKVRYIPRRGVHVKTVPTWWIQEPAVLVFSEVLEDPTTVTTTTTTATTTTTTTTT